MLASLNKGHDDEGNILEKSRQDQAIARILQNKYQEENPGVVHALDDEGNILDEFDSEDSYDSALSEQIEDLTNWPHTGQDTEAENKRRQTDEDRYAADAVAKRKLQIDHDQKRSASHVMTLNLLVHSARNEGFLSRVDLGVFPYTKEQEAKHHMHLTDDRKVVAMAAGCEVNWFSDYFFTVAMRRKHWDNNARGYVLEDGFENVDMFQIPDLNMNSIEANVFKVADDYQYNIERFQYENTRMIRGEVEKLREQYSPKTLNTSLLPKPSLVGA